MMPYFATMIAKTLSPLLALVFATVGPLQPSLVAQQKEPSTPPWAVLKKAPDQNPLPHTKALTDTSDLSSKMIAGIDRFLLKQIELAKTNRAKNWQRDLSSHEAYAKSIEGKRKQLAAILGMTDTIVEGRFSIVTDSSIRLLSPAFSVDEISWPVLDDITGSGILLHPIITRLDSTPRGNIIVIPDADQTPEDLISSDTPAGNYAQMLVRSGYKVLIPTLINRASNQWTLSNRDWAHRPSFELGRTLAGYEVQKIISAINILQQNSEDKKLPLGIIGWGEGGRLALYAGALDPRIDSTAVCGYFASRQNLWQEPADRNTFGLLKSFGDAEIASLIAPRSLIIENGKYPSYYYRANAKDGLESKEDGYTQFKGKPGMLVTPAKKEVQAEFKRAQSFVAGLKPTKPTLKLIESDSAVSDKTLSAFINSLNPESTLNKQKQTLKLPSRQHAAGRHDQQLNEILRHNQRLLQLAYESRISYMKDVKTDSMENFEKSTQAYRKKFAEDVIGEYVIGLLPPNARSRKYEVGPKTVSYQVEMDVFPDVTAYGILTLPKDLKLDGSEKRPVVVTQHGLEGRPRHTTGEEKYKAYKSFSTHLAERGFITFAPQNPYVLFDRFRTLQFKSQSIGKTLFSIAVPQHQQITNWLAKQPYVDGKNIGFYGISYGGKSAMRIPALVTNYALSICSADFGEWVWKTAATDQRSLRYSYANKGEYEIWEWNLGSTFNYAEMAHLICPRPFMVERGHFDGVEPDDRVAQEYAKIRYLYAAQLKIPERTRIEYILGPHAIHEQGTYDFLHQHLNWPAPKK
ncbi:MAG: dienelactone hydrolase family protein [Verrucomicrobiota bacterium]